jgi:hypothetical protein
MSLSPLLSAALKVLIGKLRGVAHTKKEAAEKFPRRGLHYYRDDFLLAAGFLIDETLGPYGDRIAAEKASDEIRSLILDALFPEKTAPRVPDPAAATAAEMILLGVVHGIDQQRVADWIEQEREIQSVCGEILAGMRESTKPLNLPSSEQIDALSAKQEKQSPPGSTDAAVPAGVTPANKSPKKELPADAPRSDDRSVGRGWGKQLARILRLGISKGKTPRQIADAIKARWMPDVDPVEFVASMTPDPRSAKQPENEDRSPIGQICAVFDDREQCQPFRARCDDYLTEDLQRIADAAVLRQEKQREAAKREQKANAAESGISDTAGAYESLKRRFIRESKGLSPKDYVEAMHDKGIETPLAWQREKPSCPKDYLDAYDDPKLEARRRWRKKIRDERYNEQRLKS